jgi:hypothetical protein
MSLLIFLGALSALLTKVLTAQLYQWASIAGYNAV